MIIVWYDLLDLPLHQSSAESLASIGSLSLGRIVYKHALRCEVDAAGPAVILPVAHPLAVTPAVGTEEADSLAAKTLFHAVEHRLELTVLQLLGTHGGATEGDGIASAPALFMPSRTRSAMAAVLPVPLQ